MKQKFALDAISYGLIRVTDIFDGHPRVKCLYHVHWTLNYVKLTITLFWEKSREYRAVAVWLNSMFPHADSYTKS